MSDEIVKNPKEEIIHVMNEKEARQITSSIQSTAVATCVLLQRAHDQKAWQALGYKSWAEYIDKEFKFSRARSYQLLSQGKVIDTISKASKSDVYLTEKEAKAIKKELPKITEKVSQETKDIDDEDERSDKAKEIVSDTVDKVASKDKQNFEGKIDGDEEEDDNTVSSGSGKSSTQAEDDVTPEDEENHQKLEQAKQTSFYINNLSHTLAIFPALPSADSIAESAHLKEDDKIKMRNDLKYAITWMSSFLDDLKD